MATRSFARRSLSGVAVILIALGFVVSLILLLRGLSLFANWSSVYSGRGDFIVESCVVEPGRLSGRTVCQGQLVPAEDPRPLRAEMTGPQAAFGTATPRASEVVRAYYEADDTSQVYPVAGRTTELVRAIVGVVPVVFLMGGTGAWLIGWLLTRKMSRLDAEENRYLHRFPQRFGLRPKARACAMFGGLWWLLDYRFLDDLLGTTGFL